VDEMSFLKKEIEVAWWIVVGFCIFIGSLILGFLWWGIYEIFGH
jgi:hypothetical protein